MARKTKDRKPLSLRSRIIDLIIEEGPRQLKGMPGVLGVSYQRHYCGKLVLLVLTIWLI